MVAVKVVVVKVAVEVVVVEGLELRPLRPTLRRTSPPGSGRSTLLLQRRC